MRSEEEILARANRSHYTIEVSTQYTCELDGWFCDLEGFTAGNGEGPDCSECEKHRKWVLNDKGEK